MSDLTIARRALGGLLLPAPALAMGRGGPLEPRAVHGHWAAFRTRFLSPEGRIIDTANGNISHSEGQAWGMLLATRLDDRASFDLMLQWTRRHLGIRGDGLLAWRFRPGPGPGGGVVDDLNNATDADLYFAWALLEAQRRWPDGAYATLARQVTGAILGQLVRQVGGRTVLLPGAWGFEQRAGVVLNPSYYVFPALKALAELMPNPAWQPLIGQGRQLMQESRFGRWGLPADWVVMPGQGGAIAPEPGRGDRFGYDALRVLLNSIWAGGTEAALLDGAARFWSDPAHPYVPAWTVFSTGAISPYPAGEGVSAVSALVMAARSGWGVDRALGDMNRAQHYYDGALLLLAREAWADASRRGEIASMG
ncbi:glycosyl hydrolase family 8 [Rhodovarius lipocyclicus]|uniref:glycosyl hydrolase family 8 n=1 Tax=Rhodovarius lipocyclicus TaxID=268410 RepID=UPI00135AF0C7|nr:glycosyl hydrolase family 8 [Rhodovarius lipocyclicus]